MRKVSKREYIQDKLNTIIEPMVNQLFVDVTKGNSEDPTMYFLKYLRTKFGYRSTSSEERNELEFLRGENKRLAKLQVLNDSSSDESEDELVEDLQENFIRDRRSQRVSISAEVYQNKLFEEPSYPKTESQRKDLMVFMQKFPFNCIEQVDQLRIINALQLATFQKGNLVIRQGDPGDNFYLVTSGDLSCYRFTEHKKQFLKQYGPGETFGELALLYNAPRAATIEVSSLNCDLWKLDRRTFNHIIK